MENLYLLSSIPPFYVEIMRILRNVASSAGDKEYEQICLMHCRQLDKHLALRRAGGDATAFQKFLIAMDDDGHLLMMQCVVEIRAANPLVKKPTYLCIFCGATMTSAVVSSVTRWRQHFNDAVCQKKACINADHNSDRLLLAAYLQELKLYNEAKQDKGAKRDVERPQEPQFTHIGRPTSSTFKRPNPFESTTPDEGPALKRPRVEAPAPAPVQEAPDLQTKRALSSDHVLQPLASEEAGDLSMQFSEPGELSPAGDAYWDDVL